MKRRTGPLRYSWNCWKKTPDTEGIFDHSNHTLANDTTEKEGGRQVVKIPTKVILMCDETDIQWLKKHFSENQGNKSI